MTVRFLEKSEYLRTLPLFVQAFGFDGAKRVPDEEDWDFLKDYYGEEAVRPYYSAARRESALDSAAPAESPGAAKKAASPENSAMSAEPEIFGNRVAALENADGEILSMVHLRPVEAVYRGRLPGSAAEEENIPADGSAPDGSTPEEAVPVHYIMGVATRRDCRHRGYMDRVMELVLSTLLAEGDPWCFLIAVDKAIYRHLGFDTHWELSPEEQELLYADEGLTDASARRLTADRIRIPDEIRTRKARETELR